MAEKKTRRPMTPDQKRARMILVIVLVVVVLVALGVGWLAISIGLPLWIAQALAVIITGILALFMLAQLA